jgi:hypothetical protein
MARLMSMDANAGGVAWWAHVGGFAAGASMALGLKWLHRLRPPVAEILPGTDRHSGFYRNLLMPSVRLTRCPQRNRFARCRSGAKAQGITCRTSRMVPASQTARRAPVAQSFAKSRGFRARW